MFTIFWGQAGIKQKKLKKYEKFETSASPHAPAETDRFSRQTEVRTFKTERHS